MGNNGKIGMSLKKKETKYQSNMLSNITKQLSLMDLIDETQSATSEMQKEINFEKHEHATFYPVQLVRDFDVFLDYLITVKGHLLHMN